MKQLWLGVFLAEVANWRSRCSQKAARRNPAMCMTPASMRRAVCADKVLLGCAPEGFRAKISLFDNGSQLLISHKTMLIRTGEAIC